MRPGDSNGSVGVDADERIRGRLMKVNGRRPRRDRDRSD
jgi:hypothetical protein